VLWSVVSVICCGIVQYYGVLWSVVECCKVL